MPSFSRRTPLLDYPILGLALLAFLLGLFLISPSLGDMGGDSAQYLSLGRALAEGLGYRDTHLPNTPLHVHYPPGFPLILAGEWLLFGGGSYLPFKILVLCFSSLGLYGMGLALRDRYGKGLALGALGMALGLTPYLLQSVRIQSEGPYFFFLSWFLWLAGKEEGKGEDGGDGQSPNGFPWARLYGLALLGFLMRMGGVVLFLALFLQALRTWRNTGKRTPLIWGLSGGLPVLGWLWVAETGGGGTWSYGSEWAALQGGRISELFRSASFYFQAVGASIGGSPFVAESPVLMAVLSVLVFFGWGHGIRSRGWRMMDSVLFFSLLLALLAPMRSLRYLIPIFPLLAVHFLGALLFFLSKTLRFTEKNIPEKALAFSAMGGALIHLYASSSLYEDRWKDQEFLPNQAVVLGLEKIQMNHWEEGLLLRGPRAAAIRGAYGDFLLALQAIKRKKLFPSPTLLAARKPRLVAWLTGVPCVPLPPFQSAGEWLATLRKKGVSHVIEDGLFRQTQSLFRRLRMEKGGLPLKVSMQMHRVRVLGLSLPPAGPKGR
jgi:hypothetical protein